jgi:hypothetical protein
VGPCAKEFDHPSCWFAHKLLALGVEKKFSTHFVLIDKDFQIIPNLRLALAVRNSTLGSLWPSSTTSAAN